MEAKRMADLRATDNDVEKLVEAAMGENRPALLAKFIVELREELQDHEDNWIDQDCIPQYLDECPYIVESHLEENNQVAIDEDELTKLKEMEEENKKLKDENEKLKDRLFNSSEEGNGKVAILKKENEKLTTEIAQLKEQNFQLEMFHDWDKIAVLKLMEANQDIDKLKEEINEWREVGKTEFSDFDTPGEVKTMIEDMYENIKELKAKLSENL